MDKIFKGIGKGIGYFFAFPGLLIAIAIYSVFGLIVFVFQFFKLIILFFTGRNLFSDLPEDIELKAKLTKDEPKEEENKEEVKEKENPLSLYPSDSPVYGSGYSSPLFNKEREEPKPEVEPEPQSDVDEYDNEIRDRSEDELND